MAEASSGTGAATEPSLEVDVAIVGGGPAGASTALHLVRREGVRPARVLVLDKATFPRDKPCAGAVSALGVDVLAQIGVPVTVPQVAIEGVRIICGGDVGETRQPLGICVRRTEFDAQLLAATADDGVHVWDGDGLEALERTSQGFRLTTRQRRRVDARFVAACDGAGSATRKLVGLREPERKGHLYVLDTAQVAADSGVTRGLVDFDLTVLEDGLHGYYWDFPTVIDGGAQVSRGIYDANLTRADSAQTKSVLARSLAHRGIDIATVKLRPFSTRPFVSRSPSWVPGVVLVGEAWGIDRTTGEGIAQAIEMGRIAASHLGRGLARRDDDFAGYERAVRSSTTGKHLLQSAFLARHVYARHGHAARRYLVDSDYARRAAVKWYRGESLALGIQARLGLGLLASGLGVG